MTVEAALRTAIEQEDFVRAAVALDEYVASSSAATATAETVSHTREVLEWALQSVRCSKSRMAGKLAFLEVSTFDADDER